MFSGVVKVSGVSDFIEPSQACVVSLKAGKVDADDEARRAPSPRRR